MTLACGVGGGAEGIEPLTPCMPAMLGWLVMPYGAPRSSTAAQVRDAAEGWVLGRRETVRSAVLRQISGKSVQLTTGLVGGDAGGRR